MPVLGHHPLDQGRHPWVHRAAQDQQLPVPEVVGADAERRRDGLWIGVEVFVYGRADDDDHVMCRRHDGGIGRGPQATVGHDPAKHGAGARLVEGQFGIVDALHRGVAHVVDDDRSATVGENNRQG